MPLISGTIAAGVQGGMAAKQIEWEKEKQAIDNQYQLDMWNLQNEYNSPQAQMQRFQEAGLSPQLMYSQGSNGNAASAPDLHAPNLNYMNFANMKFPQLVSTAASLLNLKRSAEEVKQQGLKTWFDKLQLSDYASKLSAMQRLGGQEDNELISLRPLRLFEDYRNHAFGSDRLSNYYQRSLGAGLDKTIGTGKYWNFRGNLADHGLSEKDHFLWRFLTQNAPESMASIFRGISSLDSILSKGLNGLGTFLGL